VFNHHIYSGFGISQQLYGSPSEHYRGMGQGNLPSGEAYKIQLYYVIKKIENKEIEYKLIALIEQKHINRTAAAFVNDTNFYSNGESVKENIQNIIQTYTRLCKATGGLVEVEKSFYYAWQ